MTRTDRVDEEPEGPARPARPARKLAIVLVKATLTGTVLAVLFSLLPREDFMTALGRAGPWLIGQTALGLAVGHVLGANKLRILLRAAGERVSYPNILRAHGAGLFANLWLPSIVGGDVVRAGLLVQGGHDLASVTVSSIIDRIIDTAALALLAGIGMALYLGQAPSGWGTVLAMWSVGILLAIAAFAVLGRLPTSRFPRRVQGLVRRLQIATSALASRRTAAARALALSVSIQGWFVVQNLVLAQAIGIELPLAAWLFAWPIAKLVAMAPVSLGGLGVREGALAALLLPLGIPPAWTVAQGLLWQASMMGVGLLAGILVFFTRSLSSQAHRP